MAGRSISRCSLTEDTEGGGVDLVDLEHLLQLLAEGRLRGGNQTSASCQVCSPAKHMCAPTLWGRRGDKHGIKD